MLRIKVPAREAWDPINEEFINTEATRLTLEHSLLSISKWESKWKRAYVSREPMTDEQFRDYVRCMCTTPVNDEKIFAMIPDEQIAQIRKYIEDPMSATVFYEDPRDKKPVSKKKTITSEKVYCWMTMYRIPFETEKWHFNRLMNLIRLCSEENAPKEKMSQAELMARNARINSERKARLHTKG